MIPFMPITPLFYPHTKTHTPNVCMICQTDLKKPSKQLTMETRRDEKKNPRICYPFPIVLCIATEKRRRITILLLFLTLCLSLSSYSSPLCFPLKTFSQRERFSSFSFPIFASYHEWNLMVKCFLSLLKFIICKIRPRDSQWGERMWMWMPDRQSTTTMRMQMWIKQEIQKNTWQIPRTRCLHKQSVIKHKQNTGRGRGEKGKGKQCHKARKTRKMPTDTTC